MQRLKKRRDYVKVARGARTSRRGFLLQSIDRVSGDETVPGQSMLRPEDEARFGFTVTKKIGNAVVRNRIRRRLKEAVRLAGAAHAASGQDLVLVGRRPALTMSFGDLLAEVVTAVKAAGKAGAGKSGTGSGGKPRRGAQAVPETEVGAPLRAIEEDIRR